MASLSFYKNAEFIMRFFLSNEETTIGRSSENDISLADLNISRVHVSIRRRGEEYVLIDRSTNGTFVNDRRVHTHTLKEGDQLTVGSFNVEFQLSVEVQPEERTRLANYNTTKILGFDHGKKLLQVEKSALRLGTGKEAKDIEIKSFPCLIGKNPSNQIILDDEYVSTTHCSIDVRSGRYLLKDWGSKNGTYLGPTRIGEVTLNDGDVFRIGKTMLTFTTRTSSIAIKPVALNYFEGMVGTTAHMREVFDLVQNVAATDATVLISGESGTGKELIAKALHRLSNRRDQVFLPLNCGAIAKDLIEGELFGHEKGAFTSASQFRKGVFEYADHGTVFLDEIGELPLDLQPKLLRVLETREVKRLGSNETISVDVRVITATNKNLQQEVQRGTFREDLFYRLFCIPITLPPLAERKQDIPALLEHFLKIGLPELDTDRYRKTGDLLSEKISPTALDKILDYHWPGNVRELKNVINRALVLSQGEMIDPSHVVFKLGLMGEKTFFEPKAVKEETKPRTLRDAERETILTSLQYHRWNKVHAARSLGIAVSTLHEKMRKYGIEREGEEG
ncbi:MAG: hypothetical protein A2284_14955 [Deltaproteobacteria bacterium RIFOXYA12_FULL_61_11]|nr:MAG: hypothetical protein A2284_14955 [Deltaproteobacteria bacterium RIFOXYA12_FULL_61_11]